MEKLFYEIKINPPEHLLFKFFKVTNLWQLTKYCRAEFETIYIIDYLKLIIIHFSFVILLNKQGFVYGYIKSVPLCLQKGASTHVALDA